MAELRDGSPVALGQRVQLVRPGRNCAPEAARGVVARFESFRGTRAVTVVVSFDDGREGRFDAYALLPEVSPER